MTAAEIIATELFGWERMHCEWPDEIWYCHPSGSEHLLGTPPNEYLIVDGEEEWPDLEDLRLKWYWVRRMEDALFARGYDVWGEYRRCLAIATADDGRNGLETRMLRATAEQRVTAALKALGREG